LGIIYQYLKRAIPTRKNIPLRHLLKEEETVYV